MDFPNRPRSQHALTDVLAGCIHVAGITLRGYYAQPTTVTVHA